MAADCARRLGLRAISGLRRLSITGNAAGPDPIPQVITAISHDLNLFELAVRSKGQAKPLHKSEDIT